MRASVTSTAGLVPALQPQYPQTPQTAESTSPHSDDHQAAWAREEQQVCVIPSLSIFESHKVLAYR